MKLQLIKLIENTLTEEAGGKNKELFDEHSGDLSNYVKKQIYDVRKAESGEKVQVTMRGKDREMKTAKDGDYYIRLHDKIDQVDLIPGDDFTGVYEPLQQGAKEDAEGFITYRETGEYEAFKYNGEDKYIFTDWNTKQKLKAGDFMVRQADDKTSSGFVVPASEFAKHFEEVK